MRAVKSQLITKGILVIGRGSNSAFELSSQTEEELTLKEKQTQFETEELLFERSQTLKHREWQNQLLLKRLEFERERDRTQFELKKLEFAHESEHERREYEMRKLEHELEAKKVEASRLFR